MSINSNHDQNRPFYEERPYIYIILSIICFSFAKKSDIALYSGIILLACGIYIILLRKSYQDQNDKIARKAGGSKKKPR